METTEIVRMVHSRMQPKKGQARRRVGLRKRFARLNGWTVAWYVFLTVAGILLYKAGAAYAMRERWYYAVGGEALALLPVLYYVTTTTIQDIIFGKRGKKNGRHQRVG